ncbi:MAG: outer membrane protein assembly factor BamD [Acidobacteriota bacterium]
MNRKILFSILVLVSLSPLGCRSAVREDPILRLSAQEALDEGKTLMADEKFARARRHLSHAFEVEPNSLSGREALLLLADSYYLDGGAINYIQAEAKYRDFLNRFPTSNLAAYAQYQIANSLAERMEKPDRDQTATEKALQAFRELIRLYPTSDYTAEAREQINKVLDNLAEHEFVVGDYYRRRPVLIAAIQRFEGLLASYPNYSERDKVLYHLGLTYNRSLRPQDKIKAIEVFDRLRTEHPESPWIADIPPVEAPPVESATAENGAESPGNAEDEGPSSEESDS